MVSAISSNSICTDAVSTVSGYAVCTNTISAISSQPTYIGVGRTVFSDKRRIDVLSCNVAWKCKSATCKKRESQAEDQFVSVHVSCSRSMIKCVTRYGGNFTRLWIIKKSIVLLAIIVEIDTTKTGRLQKLSATQLLT